MEWSRLLNTELKEVEPCCSNRLTLSSPSPSQYMLRGIRKAPHPVSVEKVTTHVSNHHHIGFYQLELPWQQLLTSPYASQCTVHFPIFSHVNSTQ